MNRAKAFNLLEKKNIRHVFMSFNGANPYLNPALSVDQFLQIGEIFTVPVISPNPISQDSEIYQLVKASIYQYAREVESFENYHHIININGKVKWDVQHKTISVAANVLKQTVNQTYILYDGNAPIPESEEIVNIRQAFAAALLVHCKDTGNSDSYEIIKNGGQLIDNGGPELDIFKTICSDIFGIYASRMPNILDRFFTF